MIFFITDIIVVILVITHLCYLVKVHYEDIYRDRCHTDLINSHIEKLDEHIEKLEEHIEKLEEENNGS